MYIITMHLLLEELSKDLHKRGWRSWTPGMRCCYILIYYTMHFLTNCTVQGLNCMCVFACGQSSYINCNFKGGSLVYEGNPPGGFISLGGFSSRFVLLSRFTFKECDWEQLCIKSLRLLTTLPTTSFSPTDLLPNPVILPTIFPVTIGHGLTESRWHKTTILFSAAI